MLLDEILKQCVNFLNLLNFTFLKGEIFQKFVHFRNTGRPRI
jgi:hypothetical protein